MNSTTEALLHQRLRTLPFDALATLLTGLLPSLGYRNVRLTGRRHFKGRNGRDGRAGYDLTATKDNRWVIVQLKQFEASHIIYQRSLDELRGVSLRSGAAEALLITSSDFSPSVNRIAHRIEPLLPIVTISGKELVNLLIRHHVGVTRTGEIDEALLRRLTQEAKGNSPEDCTGSSSFVVTVGVERISSKKRMVSHGH